MLRALFGSEDVRHLRLRDGRVLANIIVLAKELTTIAARYKDEHIYFRPEARST